MLTGPEPGPGDEGTGHGGTAVEVAVETAQGNPRHEVCQKKRPGDEIRGSSATSSQRVAVGQNPDRPIGVRLELQVLPAKEKASPGAAPRRPLPAALQFDP